MKVQHESQGSSFIRANCNRVLDSTRDVILHKLIIFSRAITWIIRKNTWLTPFCKVHVQEDHAICGKYLYMYSKKTLFALTSVTYDLMTGIDQLLTQPSLRPFTSMPIIMYTVYFHACTVHENDSLLSGFSMTSK